MAHMLRNQGLFDDLASQHGRHSHADPWWKMHDDALADGRPWLRSALLSGSVPLGPLGQVPFSFVDMGSISSVDLFGLDELIIFSFYWVNRHRYRKVVDMGANVGLHSLVLALMDFDVEAYEPDPHHVMLLNSHLGRARVEKEVCVHEAAVAPESGRLSFVRVLGNTTGSHVAGAKENAYGGLERLEVDAVAVMDTINGADLIKMDVEGLEAALLTSLGSDDLRTVDILCEVGTQENAEMIWRHFGGTSTRLFTQKAGWKEAETVADLPTSYREGSLFISSRDEMPWSSPVVGRE